MYCFSGPTPGRLCHQKESHFLPRSLSYDSTALWHGPCIHTARACHLPPSPLIFGLQVAGYAIGGGHVLHLVCDLTIAADNAVFGQTGPKVSPAAQRGAAHSCLPQSDYPIRITLSK